MTQPAPAQPAPYRVGLTLGRKALGWCVIDLDSAGRPAAIRELGARSYSPNRAAGRDPATGEPLGVQRRDARRARQHYRRTRQRKNQLMAALTAAGLMPADRAGRAALLGLDAFALRLRALSEPLHPFAVGRALWHLNQRRGARIDRRIDQHESETKAAIERLRQAIEDAGAPTLGAFLAGLHAENQVNRQGDTVSVRFRIPPGASVTVPEWMPDRTMIADELRAIWQAQARFGPTIFTDAAHETIAAAMLDQRPLYGAEPGMCCLMPEEPRAPRALPAIERLELLAALAGLVLDFGAGGQRSLTLEERDQLFALIETRRGLVRFEALRKALGLHDREGPGEGQGEGQRDGVRFVSERHGLRGIEPMRMSAGLEAILGAAWREMPPDERNALAALLIAGTSDVALDAALAASYGWMTAAQRAQVAALPVPRGHSRFSLAAVLALIPVLEAGRVVNPVTGTTIPVTLDEAVAEITGGADGHGSERRFDRLPAYPDVPGLRPVSQTGEGRDRVADPSLHIALNQARRVVNALIGRHGPPAGIVVELDRALKQSRVASTLHRLAVKRSDALEADHRDWLDAKGIAATWENRLKLRLFEELPDDEKQCVYTGRRLDREALFYGGVVIDRVLPWPLSLDDSLANKVLCCASVVEQKRDRLVADAFGAGSAAHDEILARAARLLPGKAWRFRPDAMARLQKSGPALLRHLADRQPVARFVRRYLEAVCPYPNVAASTGRLRRLLKHRWGIAGATDPGRLGLREPAAEAAIAACLDGALLNTLAAGPSDGPATEPFSGFREQLNDHLGRLLVSHRPDRAASGPLHRETAFGPVAAQIDDKPYNLVVRRPVAALTHRELGRIRDPALRDALSRLAARDGLPFPARVHVPELATTVARVRVLETGDAVCVRHGPDRQFVKAFLPHSNHAVDIVEDADGRWRGRAVTLFEAAQTTRAETDGRDRIMRLHKGDTLRMELPGEAPGFWIVRKLDPKNARIGLVPHDAAGPFAPSDYRHMAYSALQACGARRVEVSVLGDVRD